MKKLIYNLKSISFNNLWIIPFTFILTWIVFLCILDSRTTPFNPLLLLTFILLFSFLLCFTYKKLNRKYIGIEQEKTYCAWAEKRIEMAEKDKTIQGYTDGVFWERNTAEEQKRLNKKANKKNINGNLELKLNDA